MPARVLRRRERRDKSAAASEDKESSERGGSLVHFLPCQSDVITLPKRPPLPLAPRPLGDSPGPVLGQNPHAHHQIVPDIIRVDIMYGCT
jgi:hypothetical protein